MLGYSVQTIAYQPPSGGCELKLLEFHQGTQSLNQPPSGGCELKLTFVASEPTGISQPPSGGCELKLHI